MRHPLLLAVILMAACGNGDSGNTPEGDVGASITEEAGESDASRAAAIENALTGAYGSEVVAGVSVSGGDIDVQATSVVSNDTLGESLAVELCHAAYNADPGGPSPVNVSSSSGMAVRCTGPTGYEKV
jgi:hypothetical protein